MRPYEVMVIFDADLEEETIRSAVDRYIQLIESKGAEPGHVDFWGKRRFAYELKHRWEGYYVVLQAKAEPAAMDELHRVLSLADEVIRHKVLRIPEQVYGNLAKRVTGASDASGRKTNGRQHRHHRREPHPRSRDPLHRRRRRQGVVRHRREPPVAEPPDARVGGADQLLQRRLLARDGRERQPSRSARARASSSPAASSSAAGRPRTARSAAWSRSSPTRSARACAGRPPRSPATSAAVAATSAAAAVAAAAVAVAAAAVPAAAAAAGRWRRRRRRALRRRRLRRGALLMATSRSARDTQARARAATTGVGRRRRRCRSSTPSRIDWIDYKDVNLLRRFMSERAKIRARRVTGNSTQQQREVARRSASPARWRCCPTACAR